MDVENFESVDMEAVSGGGGYVDDDIDLDDDDDDDDEPLVTAHRVTKPAAQGAPSSSRPPHAPTPRSKKRGRVPTGPAAPASKSEARPAQRKRVEKPEDPRPTDYKLRAAGLNGAREFLVAHFRSGVPSFTDSDGDSIHLRLHRSGEHTVTERAEALKEDKKEVTHMNSYTGQRREARKMKQGRITIRRRMQKEWKLEVAPKEVSEKLVEDRQQRIEKRLKRGDEPGSADKPDTDTTDAKAEEGEGENDEPTANELSKLLTSYTGHFDGRTSSRYAIMVMNAADRTVDVIPVEEYSMFSFRADQVPTLKTAEEVESLSRKMRTKRENSSRMSHLNERYASVQVKRELAMGDNSRLMANPEVYNAGIKRGKSNANDRDGGGEGMDFDLEFDNDDVLQVDRELIPKQQKVLVRDEEAAARAFRQMIKDEPAPEKEMQRAEQSDSEEDSPSQQGDGNKSDPESPSSQSQQPSRQPSPRENATVSVPTKTPTPSGVDSLRATPLMRTPSNASPSTTTPRGSTPQMLDVSHLLPPAGTPPSEEHVVAVLTALTKDRGLPHMPFKEFMRYFDLKGDRKAHIMGILKRIAAVMQDPKKKTKASYLVALKAGR